MKTKSTDKNIKRLAVFAYISVAVFILTAIFVFAYFFINFDGERSTIEIPSFVGQKYTEILPSDRIKIESELVFSDTVSEGEVISQFPNAGAKRKLAQGEKYTVKLMVSMGKETRTIPNLINTKYIEAAAALRSLGADIRIVSIYDDTHENDVVINTSPRVGEKIEPGAKVTLFVSRNRLHGSICVKDFSGIRQENACAEIIAEGLFVGEIDAQYSDEVPEGFVTDQSLIPGSYVRYGSRIDLTVSAGKEREELHPFGRYITDN